MRAIITGISGVALPFQPRGRSDRFCQLGLQAVEAALYDAKFECDERNRERTAIVVGTAFGCHATNAEHFRQLLDGETVRPRRFTYTLPSAVAGEIAIQFAIRGPVLTLAGSLCTGLDALDEAQRLIGRGGADHALVVAIDEKTSLRDSEERAFAVLLDRARDGAAPSFAVRHAFVAGQPDRALSLALEGAPATRLVSTRPSAAAALELMGNARLGDRPSAVAASDPSGAATVLIWK